MFKKIALILSLVSVTILSGCATVPMADKAKDATLKEFQKPADNKAGIYVYRDTFVGQALKKNLYINGKLIGETANKTFFYQEVEPGKYTISTESEFSENDLELTVEAGKHYFVEQFIKMGVFVGGAGLQQVDAEKGMKAVKKCNLAQETDKDVFLKTAPK